MKNSSKSSGFTLIELMIAVVIVGTLSTIAVASYRNAILRSNRTDAKTALLNIQVAQEKMFLQYTRYAYDTELSSSPTGSAPGLSITTTTIGGRYTIGLTSTDGGVSNYTATATATGSQIDDTDCQTFTIDNLGTKKGYKSTSALNANCWSK